MVEPIVVAAKVNPVEAYEITAENLVEVAEIIAAEVVLDEEKQERSIKIGNRLVARPGHYVIVGKRSRKPYVISRENFEKHYEIWSPTKGSMSLNEAVSHEKHQHRGEEGAISPDDPRRSDPGKAFIVGGDW